jgi:hypothetical protein
VVGGVLGALEGLVLGLPLAAVLGRLERTARGRERGTALPAAILMGSVAVAAVASYASAPPPTTEAASLDDNPPLLCPEYLGEEIASYEGPGNQITPVFETKGDGWGFEESWAGPGPLRVRVMDSEGNEVQGPELSPSEGSYYGSGGGGSEFVATGAYKLEIEANDDLEYRVLVCD